LLTAIVAATSAAQGTGASKLHVVNPMASAA
jgi:hypothetical protein